MTLGLQRADTEYLADLVILLDDSLAVHQSEAVRSGRLLGDGLSVEDVCQLVVSHSATGVADGYLDIVRSLGGGNVDASVFGGKLAGVVGQRVKHEEGQHAVGLHGDGGRLDTEGDALHGKTGLVTRHEVEELLQGEALHMQVQFSLTKLYPLCQQLVLLVDVIGQLADILDMILLVLAIQVFHFVEDAVDKGQDTHRLRHLGALFEMATLILRHTQAGLGHLVVLLFQQIVQAVIFLALLVQSVEEP